MLRKIVSIKNVGRFRNSASSPNPTLARFVFGFGANGYGKTTLCAVLRSLQVGDATTVMGRKALSSVDPPTVELLFSGGMRSLGHAGWSASEPKMSIFDSVFVAENVHSGDSVEIGHRRAIYRVIVGSAGVGFAAREAKLAEESRTTQAALTAAERVVAAHAGTTPLQTFLDLAADEEIDVKIVVQSDLVRTLREAEDIRTRPQLAPLAAPSIDPRVLRALEATLDGVGADAEDRLRRHLVDHEMVAGGQRWIGEGVGLAKGDDCPFCGRDGLGALPLFQAYKALFSDAYAALSASIAEARNLVVGSLGEGARGALTTGVARNLSVLEFWDRHCSIDRPPFPDLAAAAESMSAAADALAALLGQKADAPLHPVRDAARLERARKSVDQASASIIAYNAAVVPVNTVIETKKAETAGGDLAQATALLDRLEATKRRHREDVVRVCAELRRLDGEKKRIEQEKKAVRSQLEQHSSTVVGPYEGRINYFLSRFNAEFRIANTGHGYPGGVATASYDLTIDNARVELGDGRTPLDRASFRNTLSSGDRTTLALAFFLAHLEREPDLGERVVVFDDPFNSQDAFRRKQTMFEILAVAGKAAQLIVLSHDPLFLKHLWERCAPAERSAIQILFHPAIGSKIAEFDLDDACKGRAAAELDDLLAYRANGAGNPREIIKKLRIVLETHYRSAFPGCFLPDDNCGAILTKVRNSGDSHPAKDHYEALSRINDYTADYHHGEDARGAAEPQLDATELLGFVEDTLRIANALPA